MADRLDIVPMNPELDPMVETHEDFSPSTDQEGALPDTPQEETTETTETPTETDQLDSEQQRRDRVQERINEVVRKQREAERREAAAVKREQDLLAELESLKSKAAPSEEPAGTQKGKTPEPEDYDTDAEYSRAYADYLAEQTLERTARVLREELDKDRKSRAEQDAQRKLDAQYDEFAREGSQKYNDFSSVALSPDLYDKNGVILNAVLNADNGVDVAHHLGTHADLADTILREAESNPMAAAIRLGQLSAQLQAASTPIPSGAPEPVPNLEGSDTGALPDPETEPIQDFMARKKQDQLKKLRLNPS